MSVLTLGETMALFDPATDGPPSLGMTYTLRIAGAESNFAVALARLGIGVRWVSRLGDDPAGVVVAGALAAEGVDLRFLIDEKSAGTGAFMKIRDRERTRVQYFRAGSAASRLAPGDVPDSAWDGVRLVHLTGITLALSKTARDLVADVAGRARREGITVTFDANYRPALWPDPGAARLAQEAILPSVDWYLCGEDEAATLWGAGGPAALEERIRSAGAKGVVIRLGHRGAHVAGEIVPPPSLVEVRDEVGAGDAFDAGFAYGLLHGFDPRASARCGHIIAARALQGTGDWETLPRLHEVAELLLAR